ncbi:MAG: hypothetical protein Q8L89_04875 [Gammaproteobacteria bacterium]|nr:hypothetical protein [Gammaproteobacteria bacterium]
MSLACGCPASFPDWHQQDIDLGGELVHMATAPMFLHMPIGYELRANRQRETLEQLKLKERWPGLVLIQTGLLRGRLLRLLEPAVSPAHGLSYLASPFQVRGFLHQGPVTTVSASVKQLQSSLVNAGRRPLELYLGHLTCPRCAPQRGGEKILLLRRWMESAALLKRVRARG